MMEQPILHTERLILRPFHLDDGPRVEELAGKKEVAETTLTIPHPYPAGGAATWIATHRGNWEGGHGVTYAIVERATNLLVGCVGVSINAAHRHGELGYWVGPDYWNRGYCTEASRAILAMAFNSLQLYRIESRHFARNPSSGRVMEKLGMKREGLQRGAMLKWDTFEDIVLFGILESDWRTSATSH
jgi:RimJ/RimL family protein N-acetyltransferase